MRALIADDESDLLVPMKKELERLGFEVVTAEDGQSALEQFKRFMSEGKGFDIAVFDYMMPKIKGDVVINEIQAYLGSKRAPRMFLHTGSNDGNLISRARATGCAEILLKPNGFTDLLDRLQGKPLLAA